MTETAGLMVLSSGGGMMLQVQDLVVGARRAGCHRAHVRWGYMQWGRRGRNTSQGDNAATTLRVSRRRDVPCYIGSDVAHAWWMGRGVCAAAGIGLDGAHVRKRGGVCEKRRGACAAAGVGLDVGDSRRLERGVLRWAAGVGWDEAPVSSDVAHARWLALGVTRRSEVAGWENGRRRGACARRRVHLPGGRQRLLVRSTWEWPRRRSGRRRGYGRPLPSSSPPSTSLHLSSLPSTSLPSSSLPSSSPALVVAVPVVAVLAFVSLVVVGTVVVVVGVAVVVVVVAEDTSTHD
ncbi:hypothetical protein BKA70DRAFT_1226795 [Coprinopsis sp. MPI-PUGE-AT-0042]|nr:hypothetical protein BKA70DRAFT_1226795 [Coprinopsis sp. MPI-PUGE-AT-0042]